MVDFRSIAHGYESPSEWIREPGITDEQSQVRQAIFDAARWRALTNVARNYPGRVRHAFQQRIKELQKQGDHEKATKMRDEFALLEPCLAAGKQVATGAHADPRGIWGLVQSITFRILQNVGKDRLPEAQQGIHRGKTDYRLDDVWDPDETYCAVELPTTLQHELRKTRMLPARRAVAGPGYPGADHHHSYPFNFRWNVVVDPTPSSEMVDIFFRATFADLANMIRGGLDPVRENLTLFTNWHDARAEAERRFTGRQSTTAGFHTISGPSNRIDLLRFIRLSKELQGLGWAVLEQLEKLVNQEADFADLNPSALRMMLPVLRSLQRAGVAEADETHDAIKSHLENPDAEQGEEEDVVSGPRRHKSPLKPRIQTVQSQFGTPALRLTFDFKPNFFGQGYSIQPNWRQQNAIAYELASRIEHALARTTEEWVIGIERDTAGYPYITIELMEGTDSELRRATEFFRSFITGLNLATTGGPKAADYHDGSPELRPFTKEDWWTYAGMTKLPGGQEPYIYHGKNATIIVGGSDQNPNAATVYVEQYDKSNAVRLYSKQFSNLDTAVSTARSLARADAKNLSLRSYMGTGWTHDRLDTSGYTSGPRTEEPWMADVAEKVTAARAKDPQHYVPTYVRIPGRDRPETILYAGNPAAIVWDITRPHPRQAYPSLRTAMGRLNLFANRVAVFSDKQFMAKYDAAREMLQRLYADGKLNSQRRDQLRSRIPAQMLSAMETQQRRRERGEPRGRENPAGELSLRLVAPALRAVAGYLGDNSY